MLPTAILFIHLDLAGAYIGLFETIDLDRRIPMKGMMVWVKGGLFLLILGVIHTGLWAIRRHVVRVTAAYFVVVGLVAIATEPLPRLTSETSAATSLHADSDTASDTAPPLVIHLLFDELLTSAAIERDIKGGDATYEAMRRLVEHYGFRVFERAFSRHPDTGPSLGDMMNAEYEGQGMESGFSAGIDSGVNAYFDDYAARGYVIKVYQTSHTDHVDFCANENVSSCARFDSYNPTWLFTNEFYHDENANPFSAVTARTIDLFTIILPGPIRSYYTGRLLARLIFEVRPLLIGPSSDKEMLISQFMRILPVFDVPGFSRWFDDFADDVMHSDRGTLLFAHFAAPHAPYMLTDTCDLTGAWETYSYLLGCWSAIMPRFNVSS